ncbi:hypothetical protein MJO28_014834 [Puccinia striiformis f. sp. tritici]|uniref:Uncharacterized protein n=1 Tax=Puccinia striiformis f. sp. tritici TaxID=168172 RepID=A0ACC0DSU0_9BASI|nr:hypothetical protein Pst134EA_027711 [Puccinia striiformis f. sp. tritici]KAH9448399.1 hypothetical protein Pst134EA_027711 [Puccinia striiformis f. sp. tritici]KAI7937914.1 hypothetical protein MJO28_014834 [Puccinia striiformis f. sp. tritici]
MAAGTMADDEYDTFFNMSRRMGQSQLSDQIMWLDKAQDESLSQETPIDLCQKNTITSYSTNPQSSKYS